MGSFLNGLACYWEFRPLESGSGPWLLPEAEPSAFQEDLIGLVMNMCPVRRVCHQEPALLRPAALLFAFCWWLKICRLQHACLLGSYISEGTLALSCLKRHSSLIFFPEDEPARWPSCNGSGLLSFQSLSASLFHPWLSDCSGSCFKSK